MVGFANCKINLGLRVIGKRDDGFHNLETVFYPVNLCDAVEIVKADKLSIQISGINVDGHISDNLCIEAYKLLAKDFDIPPVSIYLHKNIPVGAGLGGGSSDAANTIKLLNTLFELNLSLEKMEDYARRLGSDCAFFVQNKPVFANEKGDRFHPIEIYLSKYFILLVKPEVFVNTKYAYSLLSQKNNYSTELHREYLNTQNSILKTITKPISIWKAELVNDFEEPIFEKFPELRSIKEKMYNSGAIYASMSGSGSAMYGIYETEPEIKHFQNYQFVWAGKL